ncbi:MAG: SIS domain-containing protein [Myxococcota bacterium]
MDDFAQFMAAYHDRLVGALRRIDAKRLETILEVLLGVSRGGGTVYVAGNGGSASLSDHSACDLSKGTHVDGHPALRTVSLASNAALITAIANDVAYDQIFRKQLEYYLRDGDAVLLVSASGSSPNVVEACRYARKRGVPTLAFVGFDGGELLGIADHAIHVAVDDYGVVEDVHQGLMHVLSQWVARIRSQGAADAAAAPRAGRDQA